MEVALFSDSALVWCVSLDQVLNKMGVHVPLHKKLAAGAECLLGVLPIPDF